MVFSIHRNGQQVFTTHSLKCVYPQKSLRSIKNAGYTFMMDGKKISFNNLLRVLEKIK